MKLLLTFRYDTTIAGRPHVSVDASLGTVADIEVAADVLGRVAEIFTLFTEPAPAPAES